MKGRVCFFVLFAICFLTRSNAQKHAYSIHTIAFYNAYNLFDTIGDPRNFDEAWTPNGAMQWGSRKYKEKIADLAAVISQIGTAENKNMPTVLGLAEVEKRSVLEDLVKDVQVINANYSIIHVDSPDSRGLDVALLYQRRYFKPTHSSSIPLYIFDSRSKRVYTRDQLLVSGFLDGEQFSFIVNHWPERKIGKPENSAFRTAAAALNRKIIDSLYALNPKAKIITMGDFNDEPNDSSIQQILNAKVKKEEVVPLGLFNPMEQLHRAGIGTYAKGDHWYLFDQIIISKPLMGTNYQTLELWKVGVFKKAFMIQQTGPYKGYPSRNADGQIRYSDRFPVYLYLIKQQSKPMGTQAITTDLSIPKTES